MAAELTGWFSVILFNQLFLNFWTKQGTSAIFVYFGQKRDARTTAAIMIVLQIQEIQEKIKVLHLFIEENKINETAFYESLPIISESQWEKYKFLFTRTISTASFRKIDEFFQLAEGINAEQERVKEFQIRGLFLKQDCLASCEEQILINSFCKTENFKDSGKIVGDLVNAGMSEKLGEIIEPMMSTMEQNNFNFDFFWKTYYPRRENLLKIYNSNAFTPFMPSQSRVTLEKLLKTYSYIHIESNDGFLKLKKLAKVK